MENLPTLTKHPDLVADQSPYRPGLHEAGVLLHSAAYAAFQAPVNAILQPFGDGKTAERMPHISAPAQAKPWSLDWNLQQIGTGVGMILPILASRKVVTTLVPSATAELAAQKGLAALTAGEAQTLARYELGVSVGTGALYGGVLTPSKLEPGQSLLDARLKQSASAGLTFGTLSLTSMGLKNIGAAPALKDTTLAAVLKNDTAVLALSGVPAGIVSIDSQSVLNGKGLPSLKDHLDSKYLEAIYNFSVIGAGMGYFTGPRAANERDPVTPGLERAAIENSGKSGAELLQEMQGRLADTAKVPDLNLAAVKAPERISYERDIRDLPRLKTDATAHGANGEPLSLAQFENASLEHVPTPVRVYEAEGVNARVVVPEEYAARLDRFAQLKEQASGKGAAAEKAKVELAKSEMQELEGRMTVQDAFRHALMTPEPGKFKEIRLSNDSNPYDLWYQASTGNPNFSSAADTVFNKGETSWYRKNVSPTLAEDTTHEWSHLFDEHNPLYAQIIRGANKVDNLETRPYAEVPREQIAILLGEYALNANGQRVAELMGKAPVTATAIGEGLHNLLSKIPEGQRSPLHEQLLTRAELMRNEAGPVARQTLIEQIQADPTSVTAKDALKTLVLLGKPQDMQALSTVKTVDMAFEPLSDSVGARIGQLPNLTHADLRHTFVGVETMRQLGNKPLESLNLEGTRVTNAAMSYLPQTLKNLDLSGTRIGDQALPFLQRLQALETLDVSGTLISGPGMQKLQAALPKTRIYD